MKTSSIQTAVGSARLRMVSFSMHMCDADNYWVLNQTDLDCTLSWLVRTLQHAEDAHERVHKIGHIPPSCLHRCAQLLNNKQAVELSNLL